MIQPSGRTHSMALPLAIYHSMALPTKFSKKGLGALQPNFGNWHVKNMGGDVDNIITFCIKLAQHNAFADHIDLSSNWTLSYITKIRTERSKTTHHAHVKY